MSVCRCAAAAVVISGEELSPGSTATGAQLSLTGSALVCLHVRTVNDRGVGVTTVNLV